MEDYKTLGNKLITLNKLISDSKNETFDNMFVQLRYKKKSNVEHFVICESDGSIFDENFKYNLKELTSYLTYEEIIEHILNMIQFHKKDVVLVNKYLLINQAKSLQESIGFLDNYSFSENLKESNINYLVNNDFNINVEATELFNKLGMLNDERNKIISQILSLES